MSQVAYIDKLTEFGNTTLEALVTPSLMDIL